LQLTTLLSLMVFHAQSVNLQQLRSSVKQVRDLDLSKRLFKSTSKIMGQHHFNKRLSFMSMPGAMTQLGEESLLLSKEKPFTFHQV
jgi:hypothetical protein